ncbi:hypothetical protein [Neotabrizicola sp. sgz301269]|uniref:hypothetical protein n=1 Tax=Neotabrizicola sp. sgz301269 TaxID=3276282 RepID=UPI00376F519D
MIYLRRQNLLFIKTHKTASTSLDIALSCAVGDPEDIVTPLLPEDELKRAEIGGHLPQNWAWLKPRERRYLKDFAAYRDTGTIPARHLPGGEGKLYSKAAARFYNHITPRALRKRGARAMLDGAWLVTIVRHPYEQIVSWAWHQKKLRGLDVPLSQVIDAGIALPSPNMPYLFDRHRRPDCVVRYEHMAEDLAQVSDRAGLDLAAHMPVTKGGHRADRKPAPEMLSAAQKAALYDRDRLIFDAFGYER